MNTSELMIGDWVLKMESDHYVYVKVKEVYEDGIDYLFRSIRGAITATGIAPIPISVDILEKNGFEKVQNLYILRTHNKKYLSMFFIEYNITNNCLFISDGPLSDMSTSCSTSSVSAESKRKYVYEYQETR